MNELEIKPTRKTRAQRAYEQLQQSATAITFLSESELKQIALALNPDTKDESLSLAIVEAHSWNDGHGRDVFVNFCTSVSSFYIWELRTRLVFFREEFRARASTKNTSQVRAVALAKNKQGLDVWLDCENGLPWNPHVADPGYRKFQSAEFRAALEAGDRETTATVLKVLREIERAKCVTIAWEEQNPFRDEGARRIDVLLERHRPHSRTKFGDGRILAEKFYPAEVAA